MAIFKEDIDERDFKGRRENQKNAWSLRNAEFQVMFNEEDRMIRHAASFITSCLSTKKNSQIR